MLNQPRAKCCLNRGFSTGLWRLAPWHTTTKIFLCEVAINQRHGNLMGFVSGAVTHICSAASWSSPHGLFSCIVCMWHPFQCHMHSLHPFFHALTPSFLLQTKCYSCNFCSRAVGDEQLSDRMSVATQVLCAGKPHICYYGPFALKGMNRGVSSSYTRARSDSSDRPFTVWEAAGSLLIRDFYRKGTGLQWDLPGSRGWWDFLGFGITWVQWFIVYFFYCPCEMLGECGEVGRWRGIVNFPWDDKDSLGMLFTVCWWQRTRHH